MKTKKADVLGSRLAGEIANLNRAEMAEAAKLLAETDLTDPVQFEALQEKLNKTWLIMGSLSTVESSVKVAP